MTVKIVYFNPLCIWLNFIGIQRQYNLSRFIYLRKHKTRVLWRVQSKDAINRNIFSYTSRILLYAGSAAPLKFRILGGKYIQWRFLACFPCIIILETCKKKQYLKKIDRYRIKKGYLINNIVFLGQYLLQGVLEKVLSWKRFPKSVKSWRSECGTIRFLKG